MAQACEHSAFCPLSARGDDAGTGDAQFLAGLPDLLTVQDLHAVTGLSEQTIRAEINGGNLPGCRIGRRLYVPKARFAKYVLKGA